jgi:hypothetical protein
MALKPSIPIAVLGLALGLASVLDYLPAMRSVPAMKWGLCPEDGGFRPTFLRPDDIYDRIPSWIRIVSELFR